MKGKKIKIFEMDGTKIDSCCVKDRMEAEDLFGRWKKKGLF